MTNKQAYVRLAKIKDAVELAPKIREADVKEIKASDNATPLEALVLPFTYENNNKVKTFSIIGTGEEGVIGMFGVVPSDVEHHGVAWMLASDLLFNHTLRFLKECPFWVEEMGKDYKVLYNFVDKENEYAVRWLKFLGFKITAEEPQYGYGKIPFLLMTKEMICADSLKPVPSSV